MEEPSIQIVVQEAEEDLPENINDAKNNNDVVVINETAKKKIVPFGTPDPDMPIFKDPIPINENDINDRALYHFKGKTFS